jgi:hypothetical protein
VPLRLFLFVHLFPWDRIPKVPLSFVDDLCSTDPDIFEQLITYFA